MKTNCWEFFSCGREAGGPNEMECGVCPASIEQRLDGVHGGKNGGRACWAVDGTFCEDCNKVIFKKKFHNCRECDFYRSVAQDEGIHFHFSFKLREMLSISGVHGL